MCYGKPTETPCPACGEAHVRVDYEIDPPPIPIKVRPSWFPCDCGERETDECGECGIDLEEAFQASLAAKAAGCVCPSWERANGIHHVSCPTS